MDYSDNPYHTLSSKLTSAGRFQDAPHDARMEQDGRGILQGHHPGERPVE